MGSGMGPARNPVGVRTHGCHVTGTRYALGAHTAGIHYDGGVTASGPFPFPPLIYRLIHGGRNLTLGFLGGSITEGAYHFTPNIPNVSRSWPAWTMHVLQSFLRLPPPISGRFKQFERLEFEQEDGR